MNLKHAKGIGIELIESKLFKDWYSVLFIVRNFVFIEHRSLGMIYLVPQNYITTSQILLQIPATEDYLQLTRRD